MTPVNEHAFPIHKIKREYGLTFASAVIFGFLSQGMGILNKFAFHDEVGSLFHVGATYEVGRWMLDVLSKLEVFVFGDITSSLPVMHGFFALIAVAVTACVLIDIFSIHKDVFCVLIGGLMGAFPAVTATYGFLFTLPFYMLSMLLAVTGAKLICCSKKWKGILLGTVLLTCSVGIYQAYITFALCILLIHYLFTIADEQQMFHPLLRRAALYVGSVVLAMALYFLINKLYLLAVHEVLDSYNNVDQMGQRSIGEYLHSVVYAYKRFLQPVTNLGCSMYPFRILQVYYLTLAAIGVFALVQCKKVFHCCKWKAVLLAAVYALFPLAVNFIYVMAEVDVVHGIMLFSRIMPFILLICHAEHTELAKGNRMIRRGICAVLLFTCIAYCRFDNMCYLKAAFVQQRNISYFNTLVAQIKNTEGYRDEYPVVYINAEEIQDRNVQEMLPLEEIDLIPYTGTMEMINNYRWEQFISQWCGFAPLRGSDEEFAKKPEVEAMPSYPDSGSIRILDNTVVVKF